MYPLFESIKVVNGNLLNMAMHQQRVNKARATLLGIHQQLSLEDHIEVPPRYSKGVVKCRIPYGVEIGKIAFTEYSAKRIVTLKQIACESFDYSHKYQDRSKLAQLYQLRGACDEILITIDSLITDASYCNIALYDGSGWYTPKEPLLAGTQRAKLLAAGILTKSDIHISDLESFKKLVLINSMLEFQVDNFIEIDNIELWDQPNVTFD